MPYSKYNVEIKNKNSKLWELTKLIINELEKVGAKVSDSVSKNTDLVVVNNINDKSAKLEKAKELKIKIITKEQFEKEYLS